MILYQNIKESYIYYYLFLYLRNVETITLNF